MRICVTVLDRVHGGSWKCHSGRNDWTWVHAGGSGDWGWCKKWKQLNKNVLYNDKRKKMGKEAAAAPCKPAKSWSRQAHRDDGSAQLEQVQNQRLQILGRMKQCKLIKDKSVCCRPVLGGFNCGTESLRFCWFLEKCRVAAQSAEVFVTVSNTRTNRKKNNKKWKKPPGSLGDQWKTWR